MKIHIKTYGCQMNERDSEALAGMLTAAGHTMVDAEEEADVLLFNTCSVREQAERKAIGKIGYMKKLKAKNPDLVIGALGFARPSFWITTASSAVYALYVAWITSVTTSVALIWTSDTVFGAGLGIGAWLVWRRAAWQTSIPAEKRLYPQGEA